jgi:membrane protein DedA with SNARE-associated domain
MDSAFVQSLLQHGSLALFVLLALGIAGLPVPGETLLVVAGGLISQHRLAAVPTYAAAIAGSSAGITISYLIGRAAGVTVIRRYGARLHIDAEDIEDVRAVFRRAGKWGLMFGYFVPGVRHLTALVAGGACLELRLFSMFAYVGAALWSAVFLTIGLFVGEQWTAIAGRIHLHGWFLAIAALAAVVAFVVYRHRMRPAQGREADRT